MSLDEQAWKKIPGYPDYSINPLGQVRHDKNERLVAPRLNQYGVPYVGLMRGWKQEIRSLARMVALTFLYIPSEIFNTPIQLDGNPLNVRLDNLMWRPRWYAVQYKRQFKKRYDNPVNDPVHAIQEREVFKTSFEAAKRYGLLEREVVLSIINRTPAWPTYQQFELVNMK